jgi:hypothetical protein
MDAAYLIPAEMQSKALSNLKLRQSISKLREGHLAQVLTDGKGP